MSGKLLPNVGRMRLRGSDFRSYGVPVMLFMPPTEDHAFIGLLVGPVEAICTTFIHLA